MLIPRLVMALEHVASKCIKCDAYPKAAAGGRSLGYANPGWRRSLQGYICSRCGATQLSQQGGK